MDGERPQTPLPESPFDILFDRLERIHTENKSFRDQQVQTNLAIDRRVLELEFLDKQKQERMNDGAKTFSKLEEQIVKVNAKIDWPWYKVVGAITPAILLVMSWVWYAAQMPKMEKFEELRNEVYELKVQQVKLNAKIDAALTPKTATP